MRKVIGIAYSGSQFHGWQKQTNATGLTVQTAVEDALSKVADHPVQVVSAGRTDAGVHATHQIVHFDTQAARTHQDWLRGTNRYLPSSVCIRWVKTVPESFHARYSAIERYYRYVIYNHEIRPGLLRHEVTWYARPLQISWMLEAAQHWIGEHDFSAFRSVKCQAKHPIRRVSRIQIWQSSSQPCLIIVDIAANAFLHHMVRNMMGVLLPIGCGKQPVIWAKTVLETKKRTMAGETASPCGLYLVRVTYPAMYQIPKQGRGPFFLQPLS